jgi:hypothetical protein
VLKGIAVVRNSLFRFITALADNTLWNDGTLINNGNVIVSVDMASAGVMSNAGRIEIGVDYWSTGNALSSTTEIIETGADCLQGDSLISNSNWTKDSFVYVGNDFAVTDDMDGSGRCCVEDSTYNVGTWTGTFDFCDLTGGYVDSNFSSIDDTITYCTSPCNVGINEIEIVSVQTLAYLNPFKDNTVIQLSERDFASWDDLSLIAFYQRRWNAVVEGNSYCSLVGFFQWEHNCNSHSFGHFMEVDRAF